MPSVAESSPTPERAAEQRRIRATEDPLLGPDDPFVDRLPGRLSCSLSV